MAGEWIKMRNDLPSDPAVYKLALSTKLDRFAVVGRLYAFWSWADKHAVDGRVDGASSHAIDDIANCEGFAAALVAVKWLEIGEDFVSLPKYERHNGESAKERGLKNARQARWRKGKEPPKPVDAQPSTTPSTREEKRREEKKNPPPLDPAPPGGRGKPESTLPTSPEALRLSTLFRKRVSTEWDAKDIATFKTLRKNELLTGENLDSLEAYYSAERAKGDDGIHRRDLSTFLNNFTGELDRARAWQENGGRPKPKATANPNLAGMRTVTS